MKAKSTTLFLCAFLAWYLSNKNYLIKNRRAKWDNMATINMKKIIVICTAILLIIGSAISFTSCSKDKVPSSLVGTTWRNTDYGLSVSFYSATMASLTQNGYSFDAPYTYSNGSGTITTDRTMTFTVSGNTLLLYNDGTIPFEKI